MLRKFLSGFAGVKRAWTVDEVRLLIAAQQFERAAVAASALHSKTPRREETRLCLLAELAFRQGHDAAAEELFRKALATQPGFPEAHYGLSLVLLEAGQVKTAAQHAQFARGGGPNEPRYLAQLGLCQLQLGNYALAEIPLRQALQLDPKDKSSWNNLGIVLRAKGQFGEALSCFNRALAIQSDFQLAQENLHRLNEEVRDLGGTWQIPVASAAEVETEDGTPWGKSWEQVTTLLQAGLQDEAMRQAEAIASEWEDSSELARKVAVLYERNGDSESAVHFLETFLLNHPGDLNVLAALGEVHLRLGHYAQAEACLRPVVDGDGRIESLGYLAQALHSQEKYDQSVEMLKRIPLEDRTQSIRKQLASSLVMSCQYEEASQMFEALTADGLSPLSAALGGWSVALIALQRLDDALALLQEVIAVYPAEPNLRLQRAEIQLLRHEFAGGWDDYEYRGLSFTKNFRVLPFQKWAGEDLKGKSVVVLAEQGLGDQVMFASCIPDLLALGPRKLVVEAIDRVAPTLARSFPECEVVPTKQKRDLGWVTELGETHYYVPLGDLPRFFRRSVESFPGRPFLKAKPERVAYWRERLEEVGPAPWIGLTWRGGTAVTRTVLRTAQPTDLVPLVKQTPGTWVSLQYGKVDRELSEFKARGAPLHHWSEAITDLDEFSALISALSLVVTVCNTTVHYAGALGIPTLVLAPEVPEWRYGIQGERMPWYRSVAVLRQPSFGDWAGVVRQSLTKMSTYLSP
jgi:Flp pilus assembly protein TadD